MLRALLLLSAASLAANAAVLYDVNLTLPLTVNGPGTITVAGTIAVDDTNTNNIVDGGEITDLSLTFSTSLGPDTHTLLFANTTIDIVGAMLRIAGGGLVIPSTSDLVVDATNYFSFSTISPDPNSALFSVSGGLLDLGGGTFLHTRSIQADLNGPPPNFDPIGSHLSVLSQENQEIPGLALNADVPEPGSLGLLLAGVAGLGFWRRAKRA